MNKRSFLKLSVSSFFMVVLFLYCSCSKAVEKVDVKELCSGYISAWKVFYPSAALAAGDKEAAFSFEKLSAGSIEKWLQTNKEILSNIRGIKQDLSFDDRVDVKLLERQAQGEIEKWQVDRIHRDSPSLYAGRISQALTYVLVKKNLSNPEKVRAITNRLKGIRELCDFGIKTLKDGRPAQTERSIRGLESSARFYGEQLPGIVENWPQAHGEADTAAQEIALKSDKKENKQKFFGGPGGNFTKTPPGRRRQEINNFKKECLDTAAAIKKLAAHIKEQVVPAVKKGDTLGKEIYAHKLKLYTGLELTPIELENLALEEIHRVRDLMARVAAGYWQETYPDKPAPEDFDALLGKALTDMEADRENKQQDFLKLFVDLTDRSETFVREKQLATLPEKRTLFIDLSPAHFAGAAVGGVYSAGPFDPGADTLFYLPTVPDDAPEEVKEGFYRSFNNPFNTMIITHEMFPGHYLHLKIAAQHPRLVRSLFGCDLYAEGWGTFCEQFTLDAGWHNNNKMTRLAHLRKRLENATRAYTSVQVHYNGWNKEQLTGFAVHTGLLAPQFAVNLWHRVIGSPFQLTSYFLGFRAVQAAYEKEKQKAGANFKPGDFADKILYAGSVPIADLPELF
ncbi:MAG: DUF885 domain-containing protein [Candidatus Aminicenantes bacterium]|nr:DUF885 domain-containing protein [Candidatus Aminicenantes bacterium]